MSANHASRRRKFRPAAVRSWPRWTCDRPWWRAAQAVGADALGEHVFAARTQRRGLTEVGRETAADLVLRIRDQRRFNRAARLRAGVAHPLAILEGDPWRSAPACTST